MSSGDCMARSSAKHAPRKRESSTNTGKSSWKLCVSVVLLLPLSSLAFPHPLKKRQKVAVKLLEARARGSLQRRSIVLVRNADPSERFRRTRMATVTRYYFTCCIHYFDHQKLRKVSALMLCLVMQEHWI